MELYYSPEAERDLQNIRNSIIENFDREDIAKKVLKKITGAARGLLAFPCMGQAYLQNTDIFAVKGITYFIDWRKTGFISSVFYMNGRTL